MRLSFLLHKDVDEIMEMPITKVLSYGLYLAHNPTPDQLNTAQICCTLANCFAKKKYKLDDFLPKKRGIEAGDILSALTSAGGKIKRKRDK